MKKYILILSLLFSFYNLSYSQKFVDINCFPNHQQDLLVTPQFGDINNDGWLDVLANRMIYINAKDGTFVPYYIYPIALIGYYNGYINTSLGDYDNDGLLDIIASYSAPDKYYTKIFRNRGADSSGYLLFEDIGAEITGVFNIGFHKSLQWGDYDNDGDLDALVLGNSQGVTNTTPFTDIYKNNNGTFEKANAGFMQFRDGTAAFVDYDNDGDLDVALTGNVTESYASSPYTRVYQNNNGIYTETNIELLNLEESTIAIGDYDQDGKSDIFITGRQSVQLSSALYHNNGNGAFAQTTNNIEPRYWGDAIWGDFDNDGDLDLINSGEPLRTPARIYTNNDGVFTLKDSIAGGRISICSPGDFDNDGDLDLLYSSFLLDSNKVFFSIYRNDLQKKNNKPSVPANLKSKVNGKNVTLSWDKSSDAETKSDGLTYNVYVGTYDNKNQILSPMSIITSGVRMIASEGNASFNLNKTLKGLPDGKYYWSVQSVDNNFEGSAFAPEQSFVIGDTLAIDTLKLISPNGGEVFSANSPIQIKWGGLWANDTLMIEFSKDNGATWDLVTNKGINKLYNWITPDIQSVQCLFKISSSEKMEPRIVQTFDEQIYNVKKVSYSNDGKKLLSYSLDSSFRILDINTGNEIAKFRNYMPPTDVWTGYQGSYGKFSYDGTRILTVEQYIPHAFVTVWNSDASQKLFTMQSENDGYYIYAAISPNNKYIAISNATNINVYDLDAGGSHDPIKTINFNDIAYMGDLEFSPDGKYLAGITYDSVVVLINTQDWSVIIKSKIDGMIYSLDFNPESSKIVISELNGHLVFWDILTHSVEAKVKVADYVVDANYSKDGSKVIYTTSIDKAGIYDIKANRNICGLYDGKIVVDANFSPDAKYAVTSDSIIKIWELNPIASFSDVSDATWSIVKDVSQPYIEIAVDTLSANINEIIELPIRLKKSTNLDGSGINKIRTTLSFNGNILYPVNSSELGMVNDEIRSVTLELPISPIKDNILGYLKVETLLGNSDYTKVEVRNSSAVGGSALIAEQSGQVKILNICRDGGDRYVNKLVENINLTISPNPSSETIDIKADRLINNLKIYNSLGELIKEFAFNSKNVLINISDLNSGIYLIRINDDYNSFNFSVLR